jgi:hypothetical protein
LRRRQRHGCCHRLVRNCALGRTIQYATALRFVTGAIDYWMPRLRGA